MSVTIEKIRVYKRERKVRLDCTDGQWVEIFPFGSGHYTTVSEDILKSSLADIHKVVDNSDYFQLKNERADPKLYQIKALQKELERFIGKTIKTVYDGKSQ